MKMVVFDMAGTTINESNIVYKTLHKLINDAGFAVSYPKVLANAAGKEKLTAIKDCILTVEENIDEQQLKNIYQLFLDALADAYEHSKIEPQPGAEDVFTALRNAGILVVLNTGYNESTALGIIQKLGWKAGLQFDALITAGNVKNNRPAPDMIMLAMQKYAITDPAEVIKVGDSVIDIEEGKNAGCGITVGITTGAHTSEQLASANPDHIIDHLTELLPLI